MARTLTPKRQSSCLVARCGVTSTHSARWNNPPPAGAHLLLPAGHRPRLGHVKPSRADAPTMSRRRMTAFTHVTSHRSTPISVTGQVRLLLAPLEVVRSTGGCTTWSPWWRRPTGRLGRAVGAAVNVGSVEAAVTATGSDGGCTSLLRRVACWWRVRPRVVISSDHRRCRRAASVRSMAPDR